MELIRAPIVQTLHENGGVKPEDAAHIYLATFEPPPDRPDRSAFSWVLLVDSLYEAASMIEGHEAYSSDEPTHPEWVTQLIEITVSDLKDLDYGYA